MINKKIQLNFSKKSLKTTLAVINFTKRIIFMNLLLLAESLMLIWVKLLLVINIYKLFYLCLQIKQINNVYRAAFAFTL